MEKKEYEELRKKFNALPKFDELDAAFEISTIEQETHLLRAVKEKIKEKMEKIASFIESFIQPDTNSFTDIYEFRCLNDEDKETVFNLYKKLMLLGRTLTESDFAQDDTKDAETINSALGFWNDFRKEILPFVGKVKDCWAQASKEDQQWREYLG